MHRGRHAAQCAPHKLCHFLHCKHLQQLIEDRREGVQQSGLKRRESDDEGGRLADGAQVEFGEDLSLFTVGRDVTSHPVGSKVVSYVWTPLLSSELHAGATWQWRSTDSGQCGAGKRPMAD